MRGSASPQGEARGRGGTLPTRVRVMLDYAVGVGGWMKPNLPTLIAFAGAGAERWRWRWR